MLVLGGGCFLMSEVFLHSLKAVRMKHAESAMLLLHLPAVPRRLLWGRRGRSLVAGATTLIRISFLSPPGFEVGVGFMWV